MRHLCAVVILLLLVGCNYPVYYRVVWQEKIPIQPGIVEIDTLYSDVSSSRLLKKFIHGQRFGSRLELYSLKLISIDTIRGNKARRQKLPYLKTRINKSGSYSNRYHEILRN